MKKHIIWSNMDFDYERDWEDAMMEMYPDCSDLERRAIAMQENFDNLDYVRGDLNIPTGHLLVILADLDLWNGHVHAYKEIEDGNIRDCLRYEWDYGEFQVDEHGDLIVLDAHHDGTNRYLCRAVRKNIITSKYNQFLKKWLSGTATREDIDAATLPLGKYIAKVYGWKVTA